MPCSDSRTSIVEGEGMSQRLQIVILEDDADRRRVMRDLLEAEFSHYKVRFFQTAGEVILHLRDHMDQLLAVALDHDLELIPVDGHRLLDAGTGRDVADFLASESPVCPIVIHSTNGIAVEGMLYVLHEAGWSTARVIPYGDLDWIPELWIVEFRKAVDRFADRRAGASADVRESGTDRLGSS